MLSRDVQTLTQAVRRGWWYSIGPGPYWSGKGRYHGTAMYGDLRIEKYGNSPGEVRRELLAGINIALGNRLWS